MTLGDWQNGQSRAFRRRCTSGLPPRRWRTECFEEGFECAPLNLPYAERVVKMLLWQHGGWRVIVGGPRSVGEHIRATYSPRGARAFDADFMGGVYEHLFT